MADPGATTDPRHAGPDGPGLLTRIFLLALAYAAASGFGQLLAFLPPGNITAVFPASGVALAVVLRGGWRYWPGVWIGSFLGNVWVLASGRGALGITCAAAIATGWRSRLWSGRPFSVGRRSTATRSAARPGRHTSSSWPAWSVAS